MPAALLLLAVACNFLPEIFASAGGSIKAWEYVFSGVEAAALWSAAGLMSWRIGGVFKTASTAACAYGAFEAIQRPLCRLLFPMDRAPDIKHPDGLCAAAGIPTYFVSPPLIALCAVALAWALATQKA